MDGPSHMDGFRRVPHLARLAIAVVLIQLLFWLVVKPLVIGSPNPGFDRIEGYEYAEARLEAPTMEAVGNATFDPIAEMPGWHCCESGYRAFRYQFDLDEIPETGLGIAPHVRADNFRIYVNNSFVAGTGRMELPEITEFAIEESASIEPPEVDHEHEKLVQRLGKASKLLRKKRERLH